MTFASGKIKIKPVYALQEQRHAGQISCNDIQSKTSGAYDQAML